MSQQNRYSQYEQEWNKASQRLDNEMQLAQGFNVADIYLNRTYLDNFSAAPIIPANKHIMDSTKLRIIEISKLVYDENEKFIDKLKSVYSSLYSLNSSVALIIISDGIKVKFYMGVRAGTNISVAGDILESTLKGNFPGVVFEALDVKQIESIVTEVKEGDIKSLASVSIVPSVREKDFEINTFVQGIEKFIDTMRGKNYTLVSLAEPLDALAIQKKKHGYEELCSALSPHEKLSIAYGENESLSVNESLSTSFSKSINRSVSNSNTVSSSKSNGTNYSESSGTNFNGGFSENGWNVGWGSNGSYSNGAFDSYT